MIGVQVTITTHTQSECFENQGSNNIYERLSMHDGKAIGFYLTKGGNNLILNCDAYNNWDNVSENGLGGNTDGFGCHPNNDLVGYTNNVFRGCRAWFNSDDGFDCINAFEAATIENCWSFYNGYSTSFASLGDGNGFKVGGFGVSDFSNLPATIPRHVVRFCLAIRNKSAGFYANHHLGGNNWYNNSAYYNSVNYNMLNRSADYASDVPGYSHNLKNNLGWGARSTEYNNLNTSTSNVSFNYFTLSVTVNSSDFLSTDQSLLTAARQSDGSLPVNNFMRLVTSSDVINKGTNVGLAYTGSAPDLGCFESAVTTREAVTEPETTSNTPQATGLSVFPNPVKGKTMAHYVLPRISRVQLSLYDAKGALLAVLLNREQDAGSYTYPVGDNYFKAAGMYYLKLRTNDKTEMVPLVK